MQHVSFEGLGSIESWLQNVNYRITNTKFYKSSVLPDVNEIDLLVVLGGPMSVNDAEDAHETLEAVDITRSSFCMQCHGIYKSADGETIQCNTLSGSYQDTYVAMGRKNPGSPNRG